MSIWYETYPVDDFTFSPLTLETIAQLSFLMLGYLYRPYTATTIQGRLTYFLVERARRRWGDRAARHGVGS